jgi:hypothetical protein
VLKKQQEKEQQLLQQKAKEKLESVEEQAKLMSVDEKIEACLVYMRDGKNSSSSLQDVQTYMSEFAALIKKQHRRILFLETSLEHAEAVKNAYSIQQNSNVSA